MHAATTCNAISIAADGAAAEAAEALGPMPEWNLADLYPSPTAPEIARDLQGRRRRGAPHQGGLSGQARRAGVGRRRAGAGHRGVRALRRADGQARLLRRAALRRQQADPERAKFYGDISEKLTAISTELIFFDLELNQIDEAVMAQRAEEPAAGALQAVDRRPAQGEALPARGEDRAAVPREEPDRSAAPGTGCSTRRWPRCASRSPAKPSRWRSSRR